MSKIIKPGKSLTASDDKSPALGQTADTFFKKLIENSYEGITLRDKDLNMIYRSPSSERITGWKNSDRSETIMNELVHPDDSQQVDMVLKKVLKHPGKSSTCIFRSKHFGGHYIWLESTFTNHLYDPDINAIVCNFRDITEQKQAEELLHQTITELYAYKYALDESAIVAITDQKGIIKHVNDNFCKISKYSRGELLGQDHRIINSGYHDKAFIRDLWVTIENGDTWKGEFKSKAKDGTYYWVDATIVPFLDNQGKPYQYIAICFDITEKKKSEAVLIESEKKYKYLFENNPLPMLIWDFETLQIIDCNIEATLKYGYTREEFLNLTIKDIRPVEDVPLIEKFVRDEFTYGKIHKKIWRHKKKNGEIMFMDVTGHLIDYNGRKVSFALSHDITESLYYIELDKLEKNLLEMNAGGDKSLAEEMDIYLRGIEGLHPGMICSTQELKGQKLYNIAAPTLPKEYLEAIEGLAIGDNAGSCGTAAFLKQKVIVSDILNDMRWADYKEIAGRYDLKACWSYPIIDGNSNVMATFACYYREVKTPSEREENTVQRAVNILQVILESSRREQALETSNARFEKATEATDDVIWDWDLETGAVYYSQNLKKLFGHPAGINRDNLPFYTANVHPDDLDRVLLHPDDIKYGTMKNWTEEYRFKKTNGEYAVVCDRAVVIRDENGLGVRMIGAIQDITKQKQEEQRLELLESVIINANDSVVITEAEPFEEQGRRILYVNDAFTKMTGYSADEVMGKSPRILQGPKSDRAELERLNESLRKWQPCEVSIINYKKNGDEFWVNFSVAPVADEKGWFTHWISVERDITKQKNEELQKSLLSEISQIFSATDELNDALYKVLERLADFGNFEMAEAWLTGVDNDKFNLIARIANTEAMKVFYEESKELKSFVKDASFVGDTAKLPPFVFWHHLDGTKLLRHEAAKKAGLKTAYIIPLKHDNEVLGILLLGSLIEEKQNSSYAGVFKTFSSDFGAAIKQKQLETEVKQIFSFTPDILCTANIDGYFKRVNPAMCILLGYTEEELLSKPFFEFIYADDQQKSASEFGKLKQGVRSFDFENRFVTKSAKLIWLAWTITSAVEEGLLFCVAKNITDKKELEELHHKATALARIGSWEVDVVNEILYWSDITREIHEAEPGYQPDRETAVNFYKEGINREIILKTMENAINNGIPGDVEMQIVTAKGNVKWVRAIIEAEFAGGQCKRIYGSFQDIDARKKAEIASMEALEDRNTILESIDDAFFAVDKNWKVTYWNNRAEKVLMTPSAKILNKNLWKIFSESIGSESYKRYHEALETNLAAHFEDYFLPLKRWFEVSAYPSATGLSVYFKDITDRKLSETLLRELNSNLKKHAKELAISNAELEQFAYVASHDLQEPLRMVTSFMTQLEKKYGDVVDDKGRQYIHFAVDGAKRMRQIILDLLDFSRVGRTEDDQEDVDFDKLMNEILALYRRQIEEQGAQISFNNLPVVYTYKTPMRQVLQNLVGNSLKYHKAGEAPIINIACTETNTHFQFSVKDNGIGIAPEYFEKIFIIFQRLHNREEYDGTGMGLAIAKKIIENLGGKIWIKSQEGRGCTFYFTVLKNLKS